MTTTETQAPATCRCGCGEPLNDRNKSGYKRGHYLKDKAGKLTALPDPDDDLDAGEAHPDLDVADDDDEGVPEWVLRGEQPPARPAADDELTPDAEPAHLSSRPHAGRGGKPSSGKTAPRVTVAVKKDIHAKIAMGMQMGGRIWQARDPVCGGVFLQQGPDITDALCEIVLDSPDLVAWFTAAGGFMKYLNLIMAVQPVVIIAYAHHVQRVEFRLEGQEPQQQPAYAA